MNEENNPTCGSTPPAHADSSNEAAGVFVGADGGDLLKAMESIRRGDSSSADGEDALTQFLEDANERRERLVKQLAAADEFISQLRSRIGS